MIKINPKIHARKTYKKSKLNFFHFEDLYVVKNCSIFNNKNIVHT